MSDSPALLFQSGKPFFEALEKYIDQAKEEIHFQTYIFELDETGMPIAAALQRAALRGVKIYVLLDAFGSGKIPKKFVENLRNQDVEVKFYGPLFSKGRFHIARRLHRKVVVFDRKTAIVTGINVSNNYNDIAEKKAWLDFAVAVNGPEVKKLHSICVQRWKKKLFLPMPKEDIEFRKHDQAKHSTGIVRVRQNDWLRNLNEAAASYRREIHHAKQSLVFVGGYFFPGGKTRRRLRDAVEHGVDIKIILAAESDVALARNGIQYIYQWMIRNKIAIYEYLPSNVHGKVLIADKKVVTIGSYDLNNLSTYSNIELNLDIHDASFATSFQERLEKIITDDCRLITLDELYKRTNLWKRIKHYVAYQLVKSLFVLSIWLSNRKDDEEYQ